jgi:hypothetical protein
MTLEDEFLYFLDNQDYLVKKHPGRYVVIKSKNILGDFTSRDEAVRYAIDQLELQTGTFLVQLCID